LMDKIAFALLERETLTAEQIQEIVEGKTITEPKARPNLEPILATE